MTRFHRTLVALTSAALVGGGGSAYAQLPAPPGQLADGSVGTVQVTPPTVDVSAAVSATPRPSVRASVTAPPSSGAPQQARNSIGTVQVGGAGGQSASSSIGTVQAHTPGVAGSVDARPSVDPGGVDPTTSVGARTIPGRGGPQTAEGSIGTVQAAPPGVGAEGSFRGPLRPDMPDGLLVPRLQLGAGVDPAESGPQSATGSVGTVQVGGGTQTATGSAGTAQVGVPSVDGEVGVGGSGPTLADASAVVAPGPGGSQTATDSIGTVQIGGSGSQTATDSVGTAQVALPAVTGGAGSGVLGATAVVADPAGGRTRTSTATPAGRAATPLGVRKDSPLARTATPLGLPFTGLELSLFALLGALFLLAGLVVRRRAVLTTA